MKSLIQSLKKANVENREEFHLGATIAVILLLLTFVGAGFYLIIDTYA